MIVAVIAISVALPGFVITRIAASMIRCQRRQAARFAALVTLSNRFKLFPI